MIGEKRFLPYFCTQFLGAFNDNVYRYAFAILVTYYLAKNNQDGALIVNLALVAFILPFFIFGALAGQLADKYEKAVLIRRIKIGEIIIMLCGCLALYLESTHGMLAILFALGSQSAFFGPIKYSILPQHVNKDELLEANAYVEAGTFVAILFGTILGGALGDPALLNFLMLTIVGVAVLGWFTARLIPSAPAAMPSLEISFNLPKVTFAIIKQTYANRPVFFSILANSWFWFFGAIVLTQFPYFAKDVLAGNDDVAILLLATFSIGIGLGSFACAIFSRGRVEVGLVPFGALGISFFTWQLSRTDIETAEQLRTLLEILAVPGAWWVIVNLTMIAFCSGLFIVPLYAFMQLYSDEEYRSRTIAVNNILNSVFMVAAGIMASVLLSIGFSVLEVFKVAAIMNLIVAGFIFWRIPDYFLRLLSCLLMHSIYRINKKELDNIPQEGAVLVVCNHVSFFDPAILLGVLPRPARFVMWYEFYDIPVINWVFKGLKTIPIGNARERADLVTLAYDKIAEELKAGNIVVIFPEGQITKTGDLNSFQPGIDKILKRTPVTVVPMALQGMWGTWSSRIKGRALTGIPTSLMRKITVATGKPIKPENANRQELYERVLELRGDKK